MRLCNSTKHKAFGHWHHVRYRAVRCVLTGVRAVEYVRTFPPDKQPSLVHAYQHVYPNMAAKLTQQHVAWLREYEAELAGHDLPDAMHCLYKRSKSYASGATQGRPTKRVLRPACKHVGYGQFRLPLMHKCVCQVPCSSKARSDICVQNGNRQTCRQCALAFVAYVLCVVLLPVLGHRYACMCGLVNRAKTAQSTHRHVALTQHSCSGNLCLVPRQLHRHCAFVLTPGLKDCMCAVPKQIKGHNVLAYVCEHVVTRSKTPVVDALLVLYPAFAAALTLHQVQCFCAQELCELSDKALPLRVHYLYNRWRECGPRTLKRQAADAQLDRSGVPACALWVCALVTASAS